MLNESKYQYIRDEATDKVIYPNICKQPKGVKNAKRKLDGQSYAVDSYKNHMSIWSTAQLRMMLASGTLPKAKVKAIKQILVSRGALVSQSKGK